MSREDRIEVIARCCYEANKAWNDAHGEDTLSWEDSRLSTMAGVQGVLEGRSAEESHMAWCEWKRARGWTWGPVKKVEDKTHPCLVPYAELPEYQKTKDRLYLAVIHALGPSLGLT